MKFSVLMSVYQKESPLFLEQSLNSLLINQNIIPSEIVLVKDGALTEELENVIYKFKSIFPNNFKIIGLIENRGLGHALNIGLKECSYELVARMDSDDINASNRFETQIKYFETNKDVDILGGSISEFYDIPNKSVAKRNVPSAMHDILKMMKRRNPMNHVTVMFKKAAVLKAGGYKHLPYLEDYYLWIRMVESGCLLANLDDVLVYVRTGVSMYKRRGDKNYIRGWYKLQKKMKELNIINNYQIIANMVSIIIFILIPTSLRRILYERFLRE